MGMGAHRTIETIEARKASPPRARRLGQAQLAAQRVQRARAGRSGAGRQSELHAQLRVGEQLVEDARSTALAAAQELREARPRPGGRRASRRARSRRSSTFALQHALGDDFLQLGRRQLQLLCHAREEPWCACTRRARDRGSPLRHPRAPARGAEAREARAAQRLPRPCPAASQLLASARPPRRRSAELRGLLLDGVRLSVFPLLDLLPAREERRRRRGGVFDRAGGAEDGPGSSGSHSAALRADEDVCRAPAARPCAGVLEASQLRLQSESDHAQGPRHARRIAW